MKLITNMPWRSVQQARWGHSPAGLKALGGKEAVHEWDRATRGKKIPKKISDKQYKRIKK